MSITSGKAYAPEGGNLRVPRHGGVAARHRMAAGGMAMRRKVLMAAVLFITVWLLWEAEALREAAREGLPSAPGA